ncbi:MAG: hypothetical protein VB957_14070 [Pseudomonadales bacterium]|jgi:hypothetical protein
MFEHWQNSIQSWLGMISDSTVIQATIAIAGAWIVAFIFDRVVITWAIRFTSKTSAEIDDQLIEYLHGPIFYEVRKNKPHFLKIGQV